MATGEINIKGLATTNILLTDFFAKADENGLASKNTIQGLSNILNIASSSVFRGSLAIADTPTLDGWYFASESGTYTNAGSLVVNITNNLVIIIVADTQTTFSKVDIPLSIVFDSVPTESSTNAVESGGVFNALQDLKKIPSSISNNLVEAYFFDELNGINVKGQINGNDIDLTTPTNPNYTPTAKGINLKNGLIQTPLLNGVWGITIVYKAQVNSTAGFLISGGSGSGSGTLVDNIALGEINKILGGGRNWHDIENRASTGQGATELNRGEYISYHRGHTQAYNSIYGLGGRHSTTTSRCTDFDIAMAFFWNKQPTDNELNELGIFIRNKSQSLGIQYMSDDAKEKQDLYIILGESNAEGRSTLSDLSASDLALILRQTNYVSRTGGGNGDGLLQILEMGLNQQQTNLADFGPEFGVAFQRRASSLTKNNCTVISVGQGSTYLTSSANGVSASVSWNVNELPTLTGGLFYKALRQIQKSMQESINKNIGFNDIVRIGFWIGLNDAVSLSYAPDVATYQGYVQDFFDKLIGLFSGYTLELVIFRPHTSDPSSNATALSNIRTAIDNVGTANANVTVIDTDAYGLEPDGVHYDASASKAMGILLHG